MPDDELNPPTAGKDPTEEPRTPNHDKGPPKVRWTKGPISDIAGIESNLEGILMLIDQSLYGLGSAVDLETEPGERSADPSKDLIEQ